MKIYLFVPLLVLAMFFAVPATLLALGAMACVPFFLIGLIGFIWSKAKASGDQKPYQEWVTLDGRSAHAGSLQKLDDLCEIRRASEEQLRRSA